MKVGAISNVETRPAVGGEYKGVAPELSSQVVSYFRVQSKVSDQPEKSPSHCEPARKLMGQQNGPFK